MNPSKNRSQPPPVPNAGTPVWDLVIADMKERDFIGRERYGTPLQADNGHEGLLDAYQEALDQAVYIRQELEEREPGRVIPAIPHRAAMAAELRRLQAREQELLEKGTRLLEELRASDRKRMVREFFAVAGQAIGERPSVPDEATVRFRVRLIGEEFVELLRSVFTSVGSDQRVSAIEEAIGAVVHHDRVDVTMSLFVDATVDLDYVVEGARIAFGVDSTPVWQSVQIANLAKLGGPKRESDGKLMKPPGWTPPDIAGELRKQGWIA